MLVLPERERTKKGAIGVETKGVTCKIPLDLHNQISEEIRETESTMSKFIEMIIREHYEKGANGRGYSLSSSLPAPFGGYSTDKFTELRINDLTAFRTAYCIQLGVATHTGIGYDQSDDYAALTTEQKAMINTALTLGYNVETGTKYGGSAMDEYIATQILIWLIAHGQLGTGYENQIVNEITANSPAAKTIFQKLRENVVTYHTVPSFTTDNPSAVGAYTHDLKYHR